MHDISDQKVLVDVVSNVKTLPVSTVIQTVRQVLKSPPNVSPGNKVNLEVSVLQFFYAYLAQCSAAQVPVNLNGEENARSI